MDALDKDIKGRGSMIACCGAMPRRSAASAKREALRADRRKAGRAGWRRSGRQNSFDPGLRRGRLVAPPRSFFFFLLTKLSGLGGSAAGRARQAQTRS
ncbi:MAG: hypothetical protein ACOYO0_04560 [Sandarakinorhabdus sp.]